MPEHDEPDAPEPEPVEEPVVKRPSKADRWGVRDKRIDDAETK